MAFEDDRLIPNWLYIKRILQPAALLLSLVIQPLGYAQEVASAHQAAIDAQARLLTPELLATAERNSAAAEQLAASNSPNAAEAREQARRLFKQTEQEALRRAGRLRITLEARRLAQVAGADTLAKKAWQKAEDYLREAVAGLANERENIVQRESLNAQQAYDAAELAAINNSILGPAREQLKTATKQRAQRFAPRTLQRGRDLVIRARDMLQEDRYASEAAGELSAQAEAYGRRAVQINKLTQTKPKLKNIILI